MESVKNALNFYVNSNLHVAIACLCLAEITRLEFGLSSVDASWFVFFATILAYNFIRVAQISRIHASVSLWIRSRTRGLILINVIALAGILYTATTIDHKALLLLFPFILATVLYVFPGSGPFRGFRNLTGVKLLLISVTWAGATVLFPVDAGGVATGREVWMVFLQRFLFVMAITIPFDIRDLQLDDPELGTLPQKIGVLPAKFVAVATLTAFCLLEFYRLDFEMVKAVPAIITASVAAILVLKASVYQGRFYSAFWIEALPILWYFLLVIFIK